jgi:hypothetical protein
MAWPYIKLVKIVATCPGCDKPLTLSAIHQPFNQVYGSSDPARKYPTSTRTFRPECGREWLLDSYPAHGAPRAA